MKRLDLALVERGLCLSREKAKRAIMAGLVKVNRQPARKPGDRVKESDELQLAAPEKFVSRGGFKLEAALRQFQLDVRGQTAIDVGASTGGLTPCPLRARAGENVSLTAGPGPPTRSSRRDPPHPIPMTNAHPPAREGAPHT